MSMRNDEQCVCVHTSFLEIPLVDTWVTLYDMHFLNESMRINEDQDGGDDHQCEDLDNVHEEWSKICPLLLYEESVCRCRVTVLDEHFLRVYEVEMIRMIMEMVEMIRIWMMMIISVKILTMFMRNDQRFVLYGESFSRHSSHTFFQTCISYKSVWPHVGIWWISRSGLTWGMSIDMCVHLCLSHFLSLWRLEWGISRLSDVNQTIASTSCQHFIGN